jgi:tight adherence protein C
MNPSLTWAMPLVFAGVTGLVWTIIRLLAPSDDRIDDRIRGLRGGESERLPDRAETRSQSPWMQLLSEWALYLMPRKSHDQGQLQLDLTHAGYYSKSAPTVFLLSQAGLAAIFGVTAFWVGGALGARGFDLVLGGLIAACLAYLIPGFWLRQCKRKRQLMLRRSLPDFLDLSVTCLQAGMTLEGTLQRVSGEIDSAHPLLAVELSRVQHEIDLGATPDRAIASFGERTDSDVVRSLAMVCQQSRRFGTKLATALRTHADALRDRRENDAEEAAQKAAVKILIPTLLCLFPCIFIILAGPAAIQVTEEFGKVQGQEAVTSEGGAS